MRNGWTAQAGLATSTGDLLPLNILLHCRTVVESQNFVTTGLMTHVEGELFEVELSEFEAFELGEKVKITVYTPAGIQTFPSMIFAKYQGAIAMIQPPQVHRRFEEKREHPRVEVSGTVQISDMLDSQGKPHPLDEPVEVTVRNISVTGIAFEAPDIPQFTRTSRLKASVQLDIGFNCELEIVRRDRQEEKVLCGATMKVLEPEMMRPLRALILQKQVERNISNRKETEIEPKKRSFKA